MCDMKLNVKVQEYRTIEHGNGTALNSRPSPRYSTNETRATNSL